MLSLVQRVRAAARPLGRVSDPPAPPSSGRSLLAGDVGLTPRKLARGLAATLARVACAVFIASAAPAPQAAASAEIPLHYWDLPTGSHLAYVHVPASNPTAAPALVFVHGGPGACQVYSYTFARPWYERLASLGFDVYLYDQIGSGYSARLPDPRDYTGDRHVADLEAIRRQIGAEHFVLIGESHGASLSAAYIAAHPDRVARAVFVAPGALDPAARKPRIFPYATPRVAPEMLNWITRTRGPEAWGCYAKLDALLQHDVAAAYAYAGDAEMDALMDAFVNETVLVTCVHDRARLAERHFAIHGMGWWASLMTTWSEVSTPRPTRRLLAAVDFPVLILRGDSDYLPRETADEYAAAFRHATLIRIPAAGHFIWMDQPERYRDEIVAFLSSSSSAPPAQPSAPASRHMP